MNATHRSSVWSITFLAVLGLIVTACGGATPVPATALPPSATPAPAATEAPTSVPATLPAPTAAPTDTTAAPTATEAPTAQPAATLPPVTSGPLTVFDWSGYDSADFWKPFAAQYPQVKVNFSFFASDAEAFAKVQTGFPTDLVHPCSSWWQLYVQAGLVQPIDTSQLKNWKGVNPTLAKAGQFNGQQYFIPWDWGYESMLVRTDKVKQEPKSWADLWDPQYKGHVALWDDGEANHVVAALALGLDPWKTTPEQDAQIKQKLIDLKPNLVTYWVDFTEVPQLLSSGDAWIVANAWQDAYKTLVGDKVPVDYITPKEGRLGWECGYGISAKSQNLALAYAYIDAAIDPQSMANMSNQYAYGASNDLALPLMDKTLVKLMQLDQPDLMQRTVFYQSLTQAQQQAYTSAWDAVKSAP
jgi:spermidine/putrescine transport system substrate-binding protein